MRVLRRAWLIALGAALVVGVTGCAIQADSGPRDVPEEHPARVAIAPPAEGGEATGDRRIYLIAPEGSDQQLRTVLRDPKDEQELMERLILGPNSDEIGNGLRTVLPASLEVHSVRFDGEVVNIDISDDLDDLSDSSLRLAVAQIVFTASELQGAESVSIRVDGETRSWPDGEGSPQSDPLSVYDFIGYAESSQPAYPVTPRIPATTIPSTTVPATAPAATTVPAPTTNP